jgi:hypothetical protein
MFPASDVNAPFGMRVLMLGMCSNESGMESRRMFIQLPWQDPRNVLIASIMRNAGEAMGSPGARWVKARKLFVE